ncbi:MAG: DNA polymerase IV [Alcanivoracaceae bacterium]|nr:DNA polymerase IV [Alcanivoracaceae bacterium]
MTRKIIHIDCDCFYAAVETRDQPRYQGKPLAVGGDPGRRGVIATCNYEARAYGVRSAMPSARAMALCPELIIVRPEFERYRKVSQDIQAIFQRYTADIEPLSLDEAFLDVSESPHFDNRATRIAQAIRKQVNNEVGITVSAGVAPNKFLAKIASDWRKPNGIFVIQPAEVARFIETLPIEKIFGVGRVTATRMHQLGIKTCHDLQSMSRLELGQQFGSFGERLYHLCRGQDERPVQASRRRKSVSVERTFDEDLPRIEHWLLALPDLIDQLKRRMQRLDHGYINQALYAKVRYSDFSISTCEAPGDIIDEEVFANLLRSLWQRQSAAVRLLGIGVRLRDADSPQQPDLFPEERQRALALQRSRQL